MADEAGKAGGGGNAVAEQEHGRRMRREPRQQRSRDRVRLILEAADVILSAEGFEALTVRRIAEAAGVPVGSIYQFFPDKAAVVDALARTYIAEFDGAIEALVGASDAQLWDDLVGTLIDAFAELYRSRPGYVALWSGRHLSPELARADEANNAAIADGVRRILVRQAALPDGEQVAAMARIAVVVADALLQYAFRGGAAQEDTLALGELKTLLRLYLAEGIGRVAR